MQCCCIESWLWSFSGSRRSIWYHLGRSESDLHLNTCRGAKHREQQWRVERYNKFKQSQPKMCRIWKCSAELYTSYMQRWRWTGVTTSSYKMFWCGYQYSSYSQLVVFSDWWRSLCVVAPQLKVATKPQKVQLMPYYQGNVVAGVFLKTTFFTWRIF